MRKAWASRDLLQPMNPPDARGASLGRRDLAMSDGAGQGTAPSPQGLTLSLGSNNEAPAPHRATSSAQPARATVVGEWAGARTSSGHRPSDAGGLPSAALEHLRLIPGAAAHEREGSREPEGTREQEGSRHPSVGATDGLGLGRDPTTDGGGAGRGAESGATLARTALTAGNSAAPPRPEQPQMAEASPLSRGSGSVAAIEGPASIGRLEEGMDHHEVDGALSGASGSNMGMGEEPQQRRGRGRRSPAPRGRGRGPAESVTYTARDGHGSKMSRNSTVVPSPGSAVGEVLSGRVPPAAFLLPVTRTGGHASGDDDLGSESSAGSGGGGRPALEGSGESG